MKSLSTIILLLFGVSFTACQDDAIVGHQDKDLFVCGIKDPINNVKWLNEEFKNFIGGSEINGIALYKFEGQDIIEVHNSLFSSRNIHQHYCNGEVVGLNDPKVLEQYLKERTYVGMLYGTKMW
jgi:hypothetical protein